MRHEDLILSVQAAEGHLKYTDLYKLGEKTQSMDLNDVEMNDNWAKLLIFKNHLC